MASKSEPRLPIEQILRLRVFAVSMRSLWLSNYVRVCANFEFESEISINGEKYSYWEILRENQTDRFR